jgi:hypothetical protein
VSLLDGRIYSSALVLSLVVLTSGTSSIGGWKRYVNNQSRYSLDYPASWYRFGQEADRFGILNFPPKQRVKGVVLKTDGAEIIASLRPEKAQSLEDWIKLDLSDDQILESSDVQQRSQAHDGCRTIRRVVARSEVGDRAHFIYTFFYCIGQNRSMRITLANWEGDSKQAEYQAIALKITNTLRLF